MNEMNTMSNPKFMTIRQTARSGILSESALRRRLACGQLPGFYAGSRYYVHVGQLLEMLEKESAMCGAVSGCAAIPAGMASGDGGQMVILK